MSLTWSLRLMSVEAAAVVCMSSAGAQVPAPPSVTDFSEPTVVDMACMAKAWRKCLRENRRFTHPGRPDIPRTVTGVITDAKGCPDGRAKLSAMYYDHPRKLTVSSACLSDEQFLSSVNLAWQGHNLIAALPDVGGCYRTLIAESPPYLKGEAQQCATTFITPQALTARLQENTRRARAREAELCRLLDPEGSKCEQFKSVAD